MQLCVQVASHYGQTVDKRSFEGRIAFAREHVAQIMASAANPLGHGIYDRYRHTCHSNLTGHCW